MTLRAVEKPPAHGLGHTQIAEQLILQIKGEVSGIPCSDLAKSLPGAAIATDIVGIAQNKSAGNGTEVMRTSPLATALAFGVDIVNRIPHSQLVGIGLGTSSGIKIPPALGTPASPSLGWGIAKNVRPTGINF